MEDLPVPLCQSTTNTSLEERTWTHHTARYVRSADGKIFTDAKKYPIDDSIREELGCRLIILTIDGHPVLEGVSRRVGALICIVVAASLRGNLLPAKIGR
jgi:hypothetical protein